MSTSLRAAVEAPENPFKGLAYYEYAEEDQRRFAGRGRDVDEVSQGILRSRTFIVYGRSGLGKTSLMLAGVFPRLADHGCRPVHVRVLDDPLEDLRTALIEQGGGETDAALRDVDLATLVERAGRDGEGEDRLIVVVFDQFEEFFVRFADQPSPAGGLRRSEMPDPEARRRRVEQRSAFIREMGRLAADELNLRLIFTLREDWIAEMRDFADAVPEITEHMYRLMPLTSFGVRQSIVETLDAGEVSFEPRLISALVETLADVHFDPAVLQVVCSEVWRQARQRASGSDGPFRLGLADLEAAGSVRDIFQGYLDQVIFDLSDADLRQKIHTRAVLDALITEKRTKRATTREQLLAESFVIEHEELDEVLERLARHRLVRLDPRGGTSWFELVHERLVEVILDWLDTDLDFFNFRAARNLVINSCRNPGWQENPNLLLTRGQLDDTVGPFKDLLRFDEEERFFLVSSAIQARSRDLEFWIELAGYNMSLDLLDRFLDQKDHDHVRQRAVEAAGRVSERRSHFARRCLDLALADPETKVRRAAAGSFAGLAGSEELEELRNQLFERERRKAAREVLIDVVERDGAPSAAEFGRWQLWKARRGLRKRKLKAAREVIQKRSALGALAGSKAGLIWTATALPLILWIFLFDVAPALGYNSGIDGIWVWLGSVALSLLLGASVGGLVGWGSTKRVAKLALLEGREGLWGRALGTGLLPKIALIIYFANVVLIGFLYALGIGVDSLYGSSLFWVVYPGSIGFGLVVFLSWYGLTTHWAKPSLLFSKRPWALAWMWAFGASLILPLVGLGDPAWIGVIEPSDPSPLWVSTVGIGIGGVLFFLLASAGVGGLVAYSAMMAQIHTPPICGKNSASNERLRLGKPLHEPRTKARKWSTTSAILLAVSTVILIQINYRFDSLPFLASKFSITLGNETVNVIQTDYGRASRDSAHIELLIADERPRLLKFEITESRTEIFEPGIGKMPTDTVIAMNSGASRHFIFGRHSGNTIRAQLDQPFDDTSEISLGEKRLAVAFLKTRKDGWTLQLPAWVTATATKHSLSIDIGHVARGGVGCADVGLLLSVPASRQEEGSSIIISCERDPKSVVFREGFILLRGDHPIGLGVQKIMVTKFDLNIGVWGLEFSHDDKRVLVGLDEGPARILGVDGSHQTIGPWGVNHSVRSVVFSPDDTRVLVGYDDNTLHIWNLDGKGDPTVLRGHKDQLQSVVFNHDGRRVLTASRDGTARIWNADGGGEPIAVLDHYDWVESAVFSHDGRRVLTASGNNAAYIWNADNGKKTTVLKGHAGHVETAVFSADDQSVLTASRDGTARIWNTDHGNEPIVLRGHEGGLLSAAFSQDGRRILTASDDDTARIWNADGSGEPIILSGHKHWVQSAAFRHDDRRVLTASWDGTVRIWSASSGAQLVILPHNTPVTSAAFSHDGKHIATATTEGTVRIWDLNSSSPLPEDADDVFVFLRITALEDGEDHSEASPP